MPKTDEAHGLAVQHERPDVAGVQPTFSTGAHCAVTDRDFAASGEGQAQRHFGDLVRKGRSASEDTDSTVETGLVIQGRREATTDIDDRLKLERLLERVSIWPSGANHGNRLVQSSSRAVAGDL